MSYHQALEAAGATVLAYESFGDYQGTWYAKVSYNGNTFWVTGCYGSCSGCDAFEYAFGFSDGDNGCEEHRYDKQEDCADCKAVTADYQQRLAEFGRSYLERGDQTQEELEKDLSARAADYDWDEEYAKALAFVKANAIPKVPFTLKANDRS